MALAAALPLHRHRRKSSLEAALGRQTPGRIAGELAVGAAGLAIGGFALYFVKERTQEEAEHSVLESDGAFSLRRYARVMTAEVRRYGTLAEAMDQGFRPLFDYIAARHDSRAEGAGKRKIAMTVPVVVAPADQSGSWAIRFVMPRSWSRASLPEPANGVVLAEQAPRTIAALRFSGRGTDRELMRTKREELMDRVQRRGLTMVSEPEFAAYNAPIVPGMLRRNEWWVEVESKSGGL